MNSPRFPSVIVAGSAPAILDSTAETIQDLFAEQVRRTPEALALISRERALTYREFNACANRLAQQLLDSGLAPGQAVAFLCDRTPLLPIALFAILKARGHYVPLDPVYPAPRLNHILADAAPFALITDRDTDALAALGIHTAARVVSLTAQDAVAANPDAHPNPNLPASGDDLVYSIYTSGSTGKPKGTLNFQRSVVNLNRWMVRDFGVGPATRFMVMTSIGFDITSKGLCSPLLSGGAVVLYDAAVYDPPRIRRMIADYGVNALTHTPTGLYGLIEDGQPDTYRDMAGVERLCIIGEALRLERVRDWLRHPSCRARLFNGYGPTECADQVAAHEVTEADLAEGGVCPLGRAIAGVTLTVRDAQLQPVALGEKGEMCVQGICVGGGYRNLPEKTAAAFVDDPHPGPLHGQRLYRTGDLVSQRADGVFLYHGRMDFQVKIRGHRVELSEIEAALNACPGVLESVVTAPEQPNGERFAAAYLRLAPGASRDTSLLHAQLAHTLPDYMLPASYVFMDEFPVNASYKVDRAALPPPTRARPHLANAYRAPSGAVEQGLTALWARVLGFEQIGADDRFFEVGGNSLLATRLVAQLREALGVTLPIVQFFEAPTVAGLAATLQRDYPQAVAQWTGVAPTAATPGPTAAAPRAAAPQRREGPMQIAVVGMAARVPGALSVEAFWQNLLNGVNSVQRLTPEELNAAGISAARQAQPGYVPVAGWVSDAECFDHRFFGYTPGEAERIDPQQRLLLETAHAAFEQGGLAVDRINRRIGVYTSVSANTYFTRQVMPHDGVREYGLGYVFVGNDKDYSATRIAYKLGFTGPAMTVQTACSSSGTALHLACQALAAGDCDAALVGGASLPWQYRHGLDHVPDGALSADGTIRAFDASATGMVLTGGAACVVLKRLEDALADGDTVQSVLLATALNNDGEHKLSFTAPSVTGQAAVIRTALDRAGVNARSISYMEAHGTGTTLGDPIEVAALTQAWREHTSDVGYCGIGSVKTNIGHLDAAAAAAGLVKLSLMLRHGERPASLHFERPNPECHFERSPFVVQQQRSAWASEGPRRAALSSFGFGGTNFHAIVEEGPKASPTPAKRAWQVLRLSAKSDAALLEQTEQLCAALQGSTALLADVAYTLDTGRSRYRHRRAVVANSLEQAAARLAEPAALIQGEAGSASALTFLFPGQGAQHVGMGRKLYESEPVFKSAVNQCADILLPALGVDLREVLYPTGDASAAAETLRATQLAQPAIFTISYATAKLWMSLGLKPQQCIGHSVGEFVAATLAGVFELEHALLILAERARLMQSMPSGGMLAVRLSEAEASAHAVGDIAVAGINSPQLTVLSGPHAALDALKATLEAQGVATTVLHTSHAFHSPMMQPIVADFARVVGQYPLSAPRLPFYSSVTGLPITDAQAQDPHYWAQQLRQAVRFAPALQHAAAQGASVWLECGPGQNLTTSTRQTLKGVAAVASLPHVGATDADDAEHFASAIARLFVAGLDIDAKRYHAGETRVKLSLPTYPFARVRHWLEAPAGAAITLPASTTAAATATGAAPVTAAEPAATEAAPTVSDHDRVMGVVRNLFADVAGVAIGPDEDHTSFLELGFDSLLLTQVTAQINRRLKVSMRFRQLLEEFTTPAALVAELVNLGAAEADKPQAKPAVAPPDAPAVMDGKPQKVFGAGTRINKTVGEELTAQQQKALEAFIARYTARTAKSRAYADTHRPYLADPRAVSGFRPLWKDLVYPIVSAHSKGPRLTDIDGNEYVDITNGFGCIFFGHRPDFLVKAVHEQVDTDIIIGPQSPIAGECAQLFAELTGHERVAFCNTGSEAVLAAIRVARTVTGRNLIVQHTGDYHGIFDEVLVRGTPSGRTVPAAPGIPPESVVNTLILDYGDPKSLEVLRARADEIAAVVIEPVQSRKPDLQPVDYVREVRNICDASGAAMIMDEVVCGFRVHQGGAQGLWDVKGDIGCYGKVFGAGLPVGALAGTARFMDALDGGRWQFGDDSMPEVGVTYFAGTFVRHPLAMAVVLGALKHMKANPGLQEQVSATAKSLVDPLNALFKAEGVPMHIGRFGSLMKPEWTQELKFGELFYFFLREAGVNTWDARPNYLTTTHGEAEVQHVIKAFKYAIEQMKLGGFFDDVTAPTEAERLFLAASSRRIVNPYAPPAPGARVGRGVDGNPCWYLPDPAGSGRYVPVEIR